MNHRSHARIVLLSVAWLVVGLYWGRHLVDVRSTPIAPSPAVATEIAPVVAATPVPDPAAAIEWLFGSATPSPEPAFSAEAVMYDQPRLLREALAAVTPHTPGKVDLYLLAFAGDGSENVFRNEVEYVDRLFSRRFGSAGHVVVLENNAETVEIRPLANWSNLEIALDGLATKMDPTEDILVLFVTSHGDDEHVLQVALDPLPLDQIGAEDLASILATRPFRWRVAIISACYSGGFVDPLRNATTMVITASRADRTSFGCGVDSEITWFGKGFFAEGLNQSDSFRGAFDIAQRRVAEWEKDNTDHASEPQIATTPLIEAKLREWRSGITLGEPVPFAPAITTSE